jgi:hypothetical protein
MKKVATTLAISIASISAFALAFSVFTTAHVIGSSFPSEIVVDADNSVFACDYVSLELEPVVKGMVVYKWTEGASEPKIVFSRAYATHCQMKLSAENEIYFAFDNFLLNDKNERVGEFFELRKFPASNEVSELIATGSNEIVIEDMNETHLSLDVTSSNVLLTGTSKTADSEDKVVYSVNLLDKKVTSVKVSFQNEKASSVDSAVFSLDGHWIVAAKFNDGSRILRSDDLGSSFTELYYSQEAKKIQVFPMKDSHLLALETREEILEQHYLVAVDLSSTSTQISINKIGMPDEKLKHQIWDLHYDLPSKTIVVTGATNIIGQSYGTFLSRDLGKNWIPVDLYAGNEKPSERFADAHGVTIDNEGMILTWGHERLDDLKQHSSGRSIIRKTSVSIGEIN